MLRRCTVPRYVVYQKTEYEIIADNPEKAYEKWMNSDWEWRLEQEPETCDVYHAVTGELVWQP